MSDAIDRAAEAPRILGVDDLQACATAWNSYAERHGFTGSGDRWALFGDGFDAGVAYARTRAAEPPQPASVGGVTSRDLAEICRYVGVPLERARALFGVLAMVAPSEPAEPPHPSNEPVVTAEWIAVMRKALHANPEALAALSELERRLTVRP